MSILTTPELEAKVVPSAPRSAPLYHRAAREGYQVKTRLKDARRNVRRLLGTSSDGAPELPEVLDAARELARIVDLASGGRYGLAVVRPTFEGETAQRAYREGFTFGPDAGVIFTDCEFDPSSLIHEPITSAGRRERELRRRERES